MLPNKVRDDHKYSRGFAILLLFQDASPMPDVNEIGSTYDDKGDDDQQTAKIRIMRVTCQ